MQDADAVIIGAGAFGSSAAFHLAKRGVRRIALIDKYEIAAQTSPRAAGLAAQIRSVDIMTQLAIRSVKKVERFTEETGELLEYHQPGGLKLAHTPKQEEQLRREVERGRRHGLDIDLVSPSEAHRMLPLLETRAVRAMTYIRTDVYFDPAQLPLGYARASARLGATLLPNTTVTGILTRAGVVDGVVSAAGAWTGGVGEMADVPMPVVPTQHQLLITEPIEGVTPDLPIVRMIDANVYLRPDHGGLLVGGYEQTPVQYDVRQFPPDFQVKDLALDIGVLQRLAEGATAEFPVLRSMRVREHRGGLPTFTPDGNPILGPLPGIRGLFVMSGCCAGGLSLSPAFGESLAEWIVDGQPSLDLSALSPARFAAATVSDERLKADCFIQYAGGFSYR